jgi:hypothetical protein
MTSRSVAMVGWSSLLAAFVGAQDLDHAAVERAIKAGQDNKFAQWSAECKAGVSLSDKRKVWSRALGVNFTGAFRVTLLTNSGRIAVLAAEANRQRTPFTVADVPQQFRGQAIYVLVDPIKPGRDWGGGVEVPSPITGITLRSKSAPAAVAESTTFEAADVQWEDAPTMMMTGNGRGGFDKNLFKRSRATATIPMESARVLPPGDLEIVVLTTGTERRCAVAAKERARLLS